MNAEQRAFFEYGKALVELRVIKEEYPSRAPCCVRVMKDAWAKRKACRAWLMEPERKCDNCKHGDNSIGDHPCFSCTPNNGAHYWEPRKEAPVKTCVECQYWSQWDGFCMSAMSDHSREEMDSDAPACECFEPEETGEEESFPPEEEQKELP